MARETRRDERDRRRSEPATEDQPQRPYEALQDYFKLARFRMDFGARHIPSEWWKDKGAKQ